MAHHIRKLFRLAQFWCYRGYILGILKTFRPPVSVTIINIIGIS
jgi:hypothetical protein